MNSVRLDPQLQERVRRVARQKGLTLSEVHRLALEAYCDAALAEPGCSRYGDVIGVIEGPPDLAENAGRLFAELMARKHGGHAG